MRRISKNDNTQTTGERPRGDRRKRRKKIIEKTQNI